MDKDSSVPLMHHDPRDVGSLILIRIRIGISAKQSTLRWQEKPHSPIILPNGEYHKHPILTPRLVNSAFFVVVDLFWFCFFARSQGKLGVNSMF